jgi:hypothetical protein
MERATPRAFWRPRIAIVVSRDARCVVMLTSASL